MFWDFSVSLQLPREQYSLFPTPEPGLPARPRGSASGTTEGLWEKDRAGKGYNCCYSSWTEEPRS